MITVSLTTFVSYLHGNAFSSQNSEEETSLLTSSNDLLKGHTTALSRLCRPTLVTTAWKA